MNVKQPTLLAFLVVALAWLPMSAAAGQAINWGDLIDESVQDYEDPYRDLSPQQLMDLVELAKLRERLQRAGADTVGRDVLETRLAEKEAKLTDAGIDIDWLISQRWVVAEKRRKAATAGNPKLNAKQITIAGFVIPGPRRPDGVQISYLVPERGMCSHMPPPPPNQMIQIRSLQSEIPGQIYTPVKVSGTIAVEQTSQSLFLVDGPTPMNTSFALDLQAIETLSISDNEKMAARSNAWHTQLINRYKAQSSDADSN